MLGGLLLDPPDNVLCVIRLLDIFLFLANLLSLLDLLNCLINISNKNFHKFTDNVYKILDDKFKDQMVNFNQTKDDIFNIYMSGYNNSKLILFTNHIGLKN